MSSYIVSVREGKVQVGGVKRIISGRTSTFVQCINCILQDLLIIIISSSFRNEWIVYLVVCGANEVCTEEMRGINTILSLVKKVLIRDRLRGHVVGELTSTH